MTSVALEADVHERLMLCALKLNWTLSEILRHAAREWLAQHEAGIKAGAR